MITQISTTELVSGPGINQNLLKRWCGWFFYFFFGVIDGKTFDFNVLLSSAVYICVY